MAKASYEISVSTKLDERVVRDLDEWAERGFSDRSKLLRALLMAVLTQVAVQRGFEDPLENVIRRIKLEPKHGSS